MIVRNFVSSKKEEMPHQNFVKKNGRKCQYNTYVPPLTTKAYRDINPEEKIKYGKN